MTKEIEIRSLYTIEELEDVRRLESKIWGESDSIPTHQTITAVKNGGLVLGAFYEGQLIAFQYSFPGFNGQSVYLCSHILGTDEQYRNKGIGEKLKQAQRDEALKLGYSLITWTYDPLESINGYLNIGKLGGVVSTYLPNCYGEMEDLLNSGLPTDRFLVEWHIRHGQPSDPFGNKYDEDFCLANSLLQWSINDKGLPVVLPLTYEGLQNDNRIFVPIPKNFRTIRETNLELATDWRMQTRQVFTEKFAEGWQVGGFKKISTPEVPVNFYILTRCALKGDFCNED
ncbi:GNAT family N-acetyltransferase [Neobacillus cucumis]|jgi:predicted GNAT superfamily acetyltransferase|uniref:GNAT family N-acetyltransferase n=1 Tax=Neobacillus cucumis TaxID=1740721 RepID=UPI002E20897C|nr:GNAT family N-acetyltransferase [Neobacillus cucumis]MED4225657.1 GNAT family N-acetyltransferase [Neobacillus cucumis]